MAARPPAAANRGVMVGVPGEVAGLAEWRGASVPDGGPISRCFRAGEPVEGAVSLLVMADVPEAAHEEWLDSMSEGLILLAFSLVGGPDAVGYAPFRTAMRVPLVE